MNMDCKQTKPKQQNKTKQKHRHTINNKREQKKKNPTKHTSMYIHILEYKHGDEGNIKHYIPEH